MSKVANTITMLELLSSGRKYSIQELAERLEVTERMVRVYKDDLEMAGIYINSIKGQYGGYVLDTTRVLPSRGFSKYDVDLLKNAYNLLKDNDQFGLNKELLDLTDKVNGIYKATKKKSNNELLANDNDKNKFNTLNKAIKEKRKVSINFLSANGETNIRVIHPCDMFLYGEYWYISAFCELRNEIRHFRLERILEYKLLKEKYC